MTGMSKLAVYCDNGCRLSHDDTKSYQTLQNHYVLCPRKKSRWMEVRDSEAAASKLLKLQAEEDSEGEEDEECHKIGLAKLFEVLKKTTVEEKLEIPKTTMSPKVERRARKTFAGKSPEEKAQMEFKGVDDVIIRRKGNRKLRD